MAIVFSKKKALLTAAIAASFALAVALLYLLTATIDLTKRRTAAEDILGRAFGGKAALRNITVKVLPSPDIKVSGLSVGFENAILNIGSARIKLSLINLLAGRISVKELSIDGAEFVAESENGLSGLNSLLEGGRTANGAVARLYSLGSADIKNVRVRLTDRSTPVPLAFDVTLPSAKLTGTSTGFSFRADAVLLPETRISVKGEGTADGLKGGIKIENASLSRFTPYLKTPPAPASIDGKADISGDFGYSRDGAFFDGRVNYRGLRADLPGAFTKPLSSRSGSASVRLEFGGEEIIKEASVEKINIAMEGFDIKGALKLAPAEGPGGRAFAVDLRLSASSAPADGLLDLMPVKAVPKAAAERIGDFKPAGGAVAIEDMVISGVLEKERAGFVFRRRPGGFRVAALLDGAAFKYRGLKEAVTGLKGRVTITDTSLSFSDISGRFTGGAVSGLNGGIRDLRGAGPYSVSLRASLDAAEAAKTLKGFFLAGEYKSGFTELLDETDASGAVELELSMRGALKGKSPFLYSGKMALKGAALAHPLLPQSFKSLDGEASFDNDRITLKTLRLQDQHSSITVDGYISGYRVLGKDDKKPFFDITAEGGVARQSILPFIKGSALEEFHFGGRLFFRGKVHGRPDSVLAEALFDFTETDLEYKRFLKKAKGYPMALSGIAGLNKKELMINLMKLSFGESGLTLDGRMSMDKPAYKLFVSSERLRLSDLDDVSPHLVTGFNSDGFVSFSISAERGEKGARGTFEGDIKITDGRFSTPFLARPVERVNASAALKKNEAHVVIEGMTAGRTELSGRVDVPDIAGRTVDFEFSSPRFFMEDIFRRRPSGGTAAEGKAGRGLIDLFIKDDEVEEDAAEAPLITGTGSINIKEGGVFGHAIEDLALDIKLDGDAVYLRPAPFFWNKGLTTGGLTFYRKPSNGLLFSSELKFTNMDMEMLISALGARGKILTGPVNGAVTLSGRRTVPLSAGIDGTVNLSSDRGRLWKFIVMSKVFSIVNIISIDELFEDGLPYKRASGDFYIKDGVISANNLRLDSSSMRMSAAGEINLPERHIEAIMAMHPFVTIDKIITNIPLAGWIIGGRQKSSLSMYYEITGPLQRPDVSPIPIKSIGEGVLGVLERLIEAPLEAIESIQDKKNGT